MNNNLLKSGTILQNTYRILRVIDQGGMGAIYMAENRQLFNEVCAVKEMLDNYSSPEERKEGLLLFEQEAKMLNALRHPNLPRVRAYFSENNRYYLVMDYIKGRTLESIVETTSDFIPETVVLRWSESFCKILEYLHAQNPPIIFRDLNPRNIMLEDGTGEIKLIDFGIARVFKAGKNSDTISLGSPGYCPIEQYGRGQTDARSDVYTLGATLYHLLSKKVPVAAVDRIKPTPMLLTPPRQINRRISAEMEQTILRAMEINPDDRYQSVEEMRHALFPHQAPTQASGRTANVATATKPAARQQTATVKPPPTKSKTPSSPKTATSTTGPPKTSQKPRSSRLAWAVLLFVISMVIAQWVEGWQDRESGSDATPRGAKALDIPGAVDEQVNFLKGDRTDWWRMEMAAPGTLTVTVTPQLDTDRIRLTMYRRDGQTILQKGDVQQRRIHAIVEVDRPTVVLAQVIAPRIWDATRYTITASATGAAVVVATDLQIAMNTTAPQQPVVEATNSASPETAPVLELDRTIENQIYVSDGQGATWWRVKAPSTGTLAVTVKTRVGRSSISTDVFNADNQPLPVMDEYRDTRKVNVIGPETYFVKIAVADVRSPVSYSVQVGFTEDAEAFSGGDSRPAGSNLLSYQGRVRDSVSYAMGDRTDWWRLEFPETGQVSVHLRPDRSEAVSMRVFDASVIRQLETGNEPPPVNEVTGDESIRLTGNTGATYYLAVTASQPQGVGAYELVTAFALDPEANSGSDAGPNGARTLSIEGGARETVDYARGDRTDWWRLAASGPGSLTVTLDGRVTTADLQLEIYDQHGDQMLAASKTPGASREEISIDIRERGVYLVKVYAETEQDASPYQLTPWFEVAPDADSGRDGTPSGATALLIGKPSRDTVNYGEGDRTDWWKVRVPAVGVLTVELERERFLANLDMEVYSNPDDAPITSAQDRSREQVSIDVESEGWYFVKIYAHEPGDASRYNITATFREAPREE